MKKILQIPICLVLCLSLINCGEDDLNLPPEAKSVSVVGSLNPGSEITGNYVYSDPDGDEEGQSIYQWYQAGSASGDDKSVISGANANKLTISNEFAGKFLAFEVTPIAATGIATGLPAISPFTGVNNTVPTVSDVQIAGTAGYDETLIAAYTYEDLEGDLEGTSQFQWYRADDTSGTNKIKIESATSDTYVPVVADIARHLLVEVTPVASVGAQAGETVESAYSMEITSDLRVTYAAKNYNKMVLGFYPSYKQSLLPMNEIKWGKITHAIYAFAIPKSDGSIETTSLNNVSEFVSTAHFNGVEAFFSIGGGSGSEGFVALASDEETRKKFVEKVEEYAYLNNFDGVDIDWEHWSGLNSSTVNDVEGQSLVDLLEELKAALSRHSIKISIDLFASDFGGKHYPAELYDHVDWAHIMAYDFSGGFSSEAGPHSSLEHSMQALAYWGETRGLPKNKTVLGVAFYGKEFTDVSNINSSTVINRAYRDILSDHSGAHLSNQIGKIYYTGVQTMKDKAMIVGVDADYPGVMVWEIAHDTPDETRSLLSALDETLNQ